MGIIWNYISRLSKYIISDPRKKNQAGVGDGQGGLVCRGPWDRRVGHDWAAGLTDAVGTYHSV